MLITETELQEYGCAVIQMLEDPDANPEAFWTISKKIVHGIIQSNKKMVKFTQSWKDTCEFNALIKLANNARRFDIVKFNECQCSDKYKKYTKLWSLEKAIYEYYHLIAMRNIYNSVRDLTNSTKKNLDTGFTSEGCDLADLNSFDDFREAEDRVDIAWLDKRVGFLTEEENEDGN